MSHCVSSPAPKDRHLFDLSASGFSLLNPTKQKSGGFRQNRPLAIFETHLVVFCSFTLVNYVISLSGLPCLEVH